MFPNIPRYFSSLARSASLATLTVKGLKDAIFDAMLRREVFGTSGPRIVPRFFGGWNYDEDLCNSPNLVESAYATGVPMGGDLAASGDAEAKPVFIA